MLNQVAIVGRLAEGPRLTVGNEGKDIAIVTLIVPSYDKNKKGEYETDYVDCYCYGELARNIVANCKKGDLVGVKGRLKTSVLDLLTDDTGKRRRHTQVVSDKLTFLSTKVSE